MSSAADKLEEFRRAWMDADNNYQADMTAATGDADLTHDIETNWWTHQANWARAATAALEQNSAAVNACYTQAKQANDDTVAARKKAQDIVQIVGDSGGAAKSLTALLKALAT